MNKLKLNGLEELNTEELIEIEGGWTWIPGAIIGVAGLYVATRTYLENKARNDARRDSCTKYGYCD